MHPIITWVNEGQRTGKISTTEALAILNALSFTKDHLTAVPPDTRKEAENHVGSIAAEIIRKIEGL
jgi:hypothetical protein